MSWTPSAQAMRRAFLWEGSLALLWVETSATLWRKWSRSSGVKWPQWEARESQSQCLEWLVLSCWRLESTQNWQEMKGGKGSLTSAVGGSSLLQLIEEIQGFKWRAMKFSF
jgi:hypothetical protein